MDYTIKNIEKNSQQTISAQIVELVLRNIEAGGLGPGDRLPTERELAGRLGVARGTVKAAYRRLEQLGVLEAHQGSGSFVAGERALPPDARAGRAEAVLGRAVDSLREMGLTDADLRRLLERCLLRRPARQVRLAVLSSAPELLLDLRRQLAGREHLAVSVFILDSVTENSGPEDLLRDYDLIVVPSEEYARAAALLPGLAGRVVQAAVSPAEETLVALTALPRDLRVGIICRSNALLAAVKRQLLTFGFREENILSFFEVDYTTDTYFPGGIGALVSFEDAHIFGDPAFAFRNEEFRAKGGVIIPFRQWMERGTMLYLEERIAGLQAARRNAGSGRDSGT